ncbi:MAG TPA: IS5 family transposase [Gemmataceae bacterium]|nr:IS5 family transposase [Gemmataceae bacterium]
MRTHKYPSDLTDEQWALVERRIPVYPGGRPRKTSMRDVLDAIFYILRTACQWRYLPKDFPPKSTVWGYFDQWRHNGTLEDIHGTLRDRLRKQEKPGKPRRTASIDSQSVDTSSGGAARGRDNAKNVNGRKRHIVVDSLGLLLAVVVTAADLDDAAAAPEALKQLADQPLVEVQRAYADTKYHNHALYGWVADHGWYDLEIVRRPKGADGWVRLPIRWTVERTFAWLGKCRRLSIDREKSTLSAEAMIRLAMIHLMLNRLCPKEHQEEFHYRDAG